MAELGELIKLFQRQMDSQREQTEALVAAIAKGLSKPMPATSIPSFPPFDSTSELWTDYLARFYTFIGANSSPPKGINDLTIYEITDFMKNQFDPARYIVRERFKFWSEMQRKPGETIHELAARIRQDAVTCDFPSIKDPLDEAMRTRFMCSVNNEAVLKALFKVKDSELTFAKAISTAVETEDALELQRRRCMELNRHLSTRFKLQRRSLLQPIQTRVPSLVFKGKEIFQKEPVPGAARQNILQRTVLSLPAPVTSVRNWDILRVHVSRREEVPSQ
ncbi:hypothetical protein EMCRGX_G010222 [Ephydatia muelleri]